MLKVGLVGAGGIGREHLRTILAIEGVQVVGIADPVTESAQALAEQAGATAYADYHDLIGKVDAAWVCTPTFLHPEQTVTLAESGVHVFCEKPISLDLASADRMIAAAARSGVQLMVGHVIRYYPETIKIKELVENGTVGDPVYVFARRLMLHGAIHRVSWRQSSKTGGGNALESGIHEIDTVRTLGGEIASVTARIVYGDPEDPEIDTDFRALFQLQSGATGSVDISIHTPVREWNWGVVGTRATAYSPRRGEVRLVQAADREEQVIEVQKVHDAERQLNR
ncbi:MAG TPA: Gfo/Idh/MocA family oxidoreductase, partial [Chloroflexota bacterium]|nr:Gfo/Idh/MocA family oxidoreductase [Chloroflexota bacterium]